ncbi:MAG: heat-inducible transcription repressor HrcA [Anaerolineae bacterium]|jgi:heat-inducible transcriptional repressor|nr:heat-inducible transcription repressor HrcA [Anaerolineae bacterium]MBT7069264.1 heat-inducible transcription repressor HrcA [Anaerolineae bacterium]MBT7326517.1 heat-inducible transcription repressor HrcA [Anaerolineae bacterium]
MKTLTERQKTILMLVVREYIDSGQPVGSKSLVKNYSLDISSATVRNEMRALTEMDYLRTTSGRIPTEAGYRYFVRQVMREANLPNAVQRTISHQFTQTHSSTDAWMTLAASVLAHQTKAVSLVTAPHTEQTLFKHLELISTQGRQVLMILVFVGGEVSQQVLTLAEVLSQPRLSQVAERLNLNLRDLSAEKIISLPSRADILEQDILLLIQQEMQQRSAATSGEIYMDGMANILAEPSFADSDEGRRTLRFFDERSRLQDLLSNTVVDSVVGGVQVLIGGEESWEELRQCSVVLAKYGIPGQATGTLGVLGPMRMPYARTIPTVRYMADLLSGLMTENISGE